jgi:hypothetical protein
VLNVLLCAPIFGCVWLWSMKRGFEVLWTIGAVGSESGPETKNSAAKSQAALASGGSGADARL